MVSIFQQKDKGTKFFSLRYNFLITSLVGVWGQKINECLFDGVHSQGPFKQGAYIN